ncbi:hypothetical protein V2J09_009484 [Rumex salicifolius]
MIVILNLQSGIRAKEDETIKETGKAIKCLRTDRGGEFTSSEFHDFRRDNGIKRQLTTAFTPVAERKNRTVMNMKERQTESPLNDNGSNPVTAQGSRIRRAPGWMRDFVTNDGNDEAQMQFTKIQRDQIGTKVNATLFKQLVGSLMYVTATQPIAPFHGIEEVLRDLVNEGSIQLKFCGTKQHLANIFTKPLDTNSFLELRMKLGVCRAPK